MEYSHIGWIPCVNGHLDFELMEPGISGGFTDTSFEDPETTLINFGHLANIDHHARKIMLQSKVGWKDTQSSSFDGNVRVFLLAEGNDSENLDDRTLTGSIYIYLIRDEVKKTDSNHINLPWFDLIHTANNTLKKHDPEKHELWNKTQSELNSIYTKLQGSLKDHSKQGVEDNFYKVNFKICNKGFANLEFCKDGSSKTDKSLHYLINRQAFYYLKYSLHTHKHHDNDNDSLTTIIPFDKPNIGLTLVAQLKKELTNLKRTYSSRGHNNINDEQGILAYMNSLCISLHSKNYLTEKHFQREIAYLNALQSSFTAQFNKKEQSEKEKTTVQNTYRSYVTWTLSILSLLWLTIFQHFVNISDTKFKSSWNFFETLTIVITLITSILIVFYLLYRKKMKTSLEYKGFKIFIAHSYLQSDKNFHFKWIKKILLAAVIAVISFWPWLFAFPT